MIAMLIAGGIALAVSLVGTQYLIGWLRAHRVGQPIREEGPQGHVTKAGTPTMGGVAIVVASVAGYAVAHVRSGLVFTRAGMLVLALIVGAGIVGGIDDWIKVSRERNLGLNKRAKVIGLCTVAVAFVVGIVTLETGVRTTLSFTRFDSFGGLGGLELGDLGWCLWALLIILGFTNAVNLTDGLDGLAAGSSLFGFAAYTVIAFWAFRNPGYQIPHALDIAVVSASMVGATAGFLWWNAAPARIFMGDTGALAIGAGLAGLALATNTQLLLPIVGGLFVFETLSVALQIGSFRLFGKRIFRMAPIHHHYELAGWPETTVIIRFWLLAGLSTAMALGLYYADFIHLTGQ